MVADKIPKRMEEAQLEDVPSSSDTKGTNEGSSHSKKVSFYSVREGIWQIITWLVGT